LIITVIVAVIVVVIVAVIVAVVIARIATMGGLGLRLRRSAPIAGVVH